MADSVTPQFHIVMPDAKAPGGIEVLINGTPLRNVVSVQFENGAYLDELVRSSITIDLIGEPVLVSMGRGRVSL